jgi:hypothetical protein
MQKSDVTQLSIAINVPKPVRDRNSNVQAFLRLEDLQNA